MDKNEDDFDNYLKILLWSASCDGKTTFLHKVKNDEIIDISKYPPEGINIETINFNGIDMLFYDVGSGSYHIESGRIGLFSHNDVIIYFIDSSFPLDDDYIHKANNYELNECIKFLEDKPLLIVISKIDKRKTSTLDLIETYHLEKLFSRKQKVGIIECSSFTSVGVKEILYWLSSIVKP